MCLYECDWSKQFVTMLWHVLLVYLTGMFSQSFKTEYWKLKLKHKLTHIFLLSTQKVKQCCIIEAGEAPNLLKSLPLLLTAERSRPYHLQGHLCSYSKKGSKVRRVVFLFLYIWTNQKNNNFPLFLSLKTNCRGSMGQMAELFSWKISLKKHQSDNPSPFILPNHRLISSAALPQKQHSP